MFYKCEFPYCEFKTVDRSSIDFHHIEPKELGGKNSAKNRIWLCPNHHRKIFVEKSKGGLHSIFKEDSIILLNRLSSTTGSVLRFKKYDGKTYLYFYALKTETEE